MPEDAAVVVEARDVSLEAGGADCDTAGRAIGRQDRDGVVEFGPRGVRVGAPRARRGARRRGLVAAHRCGLGPHAEPLARRLGGKGKQTVHAGAQSGVVLGQHEDGVVLRAEGLPGEGHESSAATGVVLGEPLGEDALGEGRLDEPALAASSENDGVPLDDEAGLDEAATQAVVFVVPLRVEGHEQAVEVGDAGLQPPLRQGVRERLGGRAQPRLVAVERDHHLAALVAEEPADRLAIVDDDLALIEPHVRREGRGELLRRPDVDLVRSDEARQEVPRLHAPRAGAVVLTHPELLSPRRPGGAVDLRRHGAVRPPQGDLDRHECGEGPPALARDRDLAAERAADQRGRCRHLDPPHPLWQERVELALVEPHVGGEGPQLPFVLQRRLLHLQHVVADPRPRRDADRADLGRHRDLLAESPALERRRLVAVDEQVSAVLVAL